MSTEKDLAELADVCALNEAVLAKLIGFIAEEIIRADPAAKARLKAKLRDVAGPAAERDRALARQLVKQVARSAGMRLDL